MKIAADSSANLKTLKGVSFASVPLKVMIAEKEYPDAEGLDVEEMIRAVEATTGKTGTACPGTGEWIDAFGEEDEVLVFTLTGTLSGCYNSAVAAADQYMEEHPGRRVKVIDTLSTGPEMELLIEKCAAAAEAGQSFDEVCALAEAYGRETGLVFVLATLDHFAKNGRVNPALARLVGVLNIHIVGRASDGGDLEPLHKCRGEKKAVEKLWKEMCDEGYRGGRVRIRHTSNRGAAKKLIHFILDEYPDADVKAGANRGICSYYAERGGLLVGFEKDPGEVKAAETDLSSGAAAETDIPTDGQDREHGRIRRLLEKGIHGRTKSE